MIENTRTTNVTKREGRYTQGGRSDIYSSRIGWWERRVLPTHSTDIVFEISTRTEFRPDLISYETYGVAIYAWMVMQFNNIVDPNLELTAGTRITLPSPERLDSIVLGSSLGGNRINRAS